MTIKEETRALPVEYQEARLADLLEHVRAGFGYYDAGEMGVFDLDEMIRDYARASREVRN
jgi:hypothetical protein